MKKLLVLLFPLYVGGQTNNCPKLLMGVGITSGYSFTKHALVGEGYLSLKKPGSHLIITPLSMKIHGAMSDPTLPVIFESRLGYKIGPLETYAGYGYHMAGQDNKDEYRQYKGFYPGVGLIAHIYQKIILSAGLSRFDKNKIFTVQLGIFDFEKIK